MLARLRGFSQVLTGAIEWLQAVQSLARWTWRLTLSLYVIAQSSLWLQVIFSIACSLSSGLTQKHSCCVLLCELLHEYGNPNPGDLECSRSYGMMQYVQKANDSEVHNLPF